MVVDEIQKELSKPKQIFEEWRAADAQARSVEERLAAAWQEYLDNDGAAPPSGLIADVWGARAQANEKLTIALAEMSIEIRSRREGTQRRS